MTTPLGPLKFSFNRLKSNTPSSTPSISRALRSSGTSSPYWMPPIEAWRNCIWLHVSVPVLSEKIYSIWPSSSTREEVRQTAGVSVRSEEHTSELQSQFHLV